VIISDLDLPQENVCDDRGDTSQLYYMFLLQYLYMPIAYIVDLWCGVRVYTVIVIIKLLLQQLIIVHTYVICLVCSCDAPNSQK